MAPWFGPATITDIDWRFAMADGEFGRTLPHLIAAYERGQLVPFIGSGLSIGTCPDWLGMIERLEDRANNTSEQLGATPEDLIRRQ